MARAGSDRHCNHGGFLLPGGRKEGEIPQVRHGQMDVPHGHKNGKDQPRLLCTGGFITAIQPASEHRVGYDLSTTRDSVDSLILLRR